jgi:mannan endo-1,4-beta-mannosidase
VTSVEDRLRAAIRAQVREIETGALPPLRLPARGRGFVFLACGGGEKDSTRPRPGWRGWLAPTACAVLVGAIAVADVSLAGGSPAARRPAAQAHAHAPPEAPPENAVLRPRIFSYLGVYASGAPPGYRPVADFAKAAGRQPDLVGYFSRWQQPFNTTYAATLHGHRSEMLVQIDPENVSLAALAAGRYDGYLSSYAESVRHFGHPVVISFGHDMNAQTYTWGYRNTPSAVFVAAWRHIVTLFHSLGADNVTWLWTIQAGGRRVSPAAPWWPGSKYVTWVGIDGFYNRPSDTFATLFGPAIAQVRMLTAGPILAETGVEPEPGAFLKIKDLFDGVRAYGLLGLVWFEIPGIGGLQGWRLQDNRLAEMSFHLGVREDMAAP